MLDLAGCRELEALFDAALGLQLGHFLSFARTSERVFEPPRQPFRPGRSVVSNDLEARPYRGGSSSAQVARSLLTSTMPSTPAIIAPSTNRLAKARKAATIAAGQRSHQTGISQAPYVAPHSKT